MLEFISIIQSVTPVAWDVVAMSSVIPQANAGWAEVAAATATLLSTKWMISIMGLFALFMILITEKVDKTLVSILIAWLLIFLQVFTSGHGGPSSQEVATAFIYHNLDIFWFIIWMMIITGIVKDSWIFNYLAIQMVKKLKWDPVKLFFIFSYMAFIMTVFISNIPTIIILAPIVVLVVSKLDIPRIPFLIWIITFANLGWAVTPISDPTTYYQATTLWFSFPEVFLNTGLIMLTVTVSSSIYLYLVFRKDLSHKPTQKAVDKLKDKKWLKDTKEVVISTTILFSVILLVVFKDLIFDATGIKFDNGSITLFWAFLAILLLKHDVQTVLTSKVDYSTIFFFAGLFIVVGALEHNGIIIMLADRLVKITWWSEGGLLAMLTMWSALLSVFVDNVPYNIAMVSTLQQFADTWVITWAAWMALAWGLNSCTSIGGAGSPIGAACNVIALWEAEKSWVIVLFLKYLKIWIPLVLINSFIAYAILYFRYLM